MAFQLKSTGDVSAPVNLLVYGMAGAGKTTLIKTLPAPIILSAEGGLLAIRDANLPYREIKDLSTLREAYLWLSDSEEATQFASVAIDSLSEIAEVVLTDEKKVAKDPRQAYGAMQDAVTQIIRAFRDLPKIVYMSAKLEKMQDEMGRVLYGPKMPGNKLGQDLPYFFDEVLALRVEKNEQKVSERWLQCDSDGLWQAKDRSGKLSMWEAPNLGAVIAKIRGIKQ